MTRKKTNPSYKPNYLTADNSTLNWQVFLNGNLQDKCVVANVRRGYVIVYYDPPEVINGELKTYKKRGRVKLVRINK